jgi:hypothetical protein
MTLISIPPTLLLYLLSGQMKQKFVELAATFEWIRKVLRSSIRSPVKLAWR